MAGSSPLMQVVNICLERRHISRPPTEPVQFDVVAEEGDVGAIADAFEDILDKGTEI